MDSQYIFKTMYTIENMILQLEGTGKKEEYIRGIKKVYIDAQGKSSVNAKLQINQSV